MLESLRGQRKRLASVLENGAATTRLLACTGVLQSIHAKGILRFVRDIRWSRRALEPTLALRWYAASQGDKLFVADEKEILTYQEAHDRVEELCHGLAAHIKQGQRVALMLPNCVDYVLLQIATLKIGATSVHVGTKLKAKEIQHVFENSKICAVIYHKDFEETIDKVSENSPLVFSRFVTEESSSAKHKSLSSLRNLSSAQFQPQRLGSNIIYTSGTTGRQKGACRSYSGLGMTAVVDLISKVGIRNDDKHLVVCPLYHSAAPAFMGMVLMLGGSLVTMKKFDEVELLETIQSMRITSVCVVPTMLARLVAISDRVLRRFDLSSLRWVMSGSAPLPPETAMAFQNKFGPMLWNFYGATETGLVTLASPTDHESHRGSVGQPLRGNELKILGDSGAEVPTGETGELFVRNSMLISGYFADPIATNKSMNNGFFSVGDLAKIDHEGYLFIQSRVSDMVISGGVNIYPREIEDALRSLPQLEDVAVIGRPDPLWGESLHAFVVARDPNDRNTEAIEAHCRRSLAGYKRPKRYTFLPSIPRNATGKIKKRELRALSMTES